MRRGRKRLISEDKYSAFEDEGKFFAGKESETIGATQSKDSASKSKESADTAPWTSPKVCAAPHVLLEGIPVLILDLNSTRRNSEGIGKRKGGGVGGVGGVTGGIGDRDMPHVNAAGGGDDFASTDEVKVYKDEGDEEQRSSENLSEDKLGLVTETEEVRLNMPCSLVSKVIRIFIWRRHA